MPIQLESSHTTTIFWEVTILINFVWQTKLNGSTHPTGCASVLDFIPYIYEVFDTSALSEVILETAIYASLCAFTSSYLKEIYELWNVENRKEDLSMEEYEILQVYVDEKKMLGNK